MLTTRNFITLLKPSILSNVIDITRCCFFLHVTKDEVLLFWTTSLDESPKIEALFPVANIFRDQIMVERSLSKVGAVREDSNNLIKAMAQAKGYRIVFCD